MSVKPSVARMEVWPEAQRTNRMLEALADASGLIHYLDAGSHMLQQNGEVMTDIFVEDNLHLNEKGTDIWAAAIREGSCRWSCGTSPPKAAEHGANVVRASCIECRDRRKNTRSREESTMKSRFLASIPLAAVAVLLALPAGAQQGFTRTTPGTVRILQSNSGGDNIHIIDPATNEIVGEIDGVPLPHGVSYHPDGSVYYASNEYDHTIDVISTETLQVIKQIPLSERPNNIGSRRTARSSTWRSPAPAPAWT